MARVEVTIDKVLEVTRSIRALISQRTMVGVPSDKDSRKEGGPINNAALAYIHNFGAPEVNIPPRPFMEPGIDRVKNQISTELKATGQAAFDGKFDRVDRGFHRIGLLAQASIRAMITAGEGFPPLKPKTIARRKRRGRTGTKPLIDTGQLRNSINYVIRKASEV